MTTSFTAVRLNRPALRFVMICFVTFVVLSLLLWREGARDREFLLAHNALRSNPGVAAVAAAFSRFGMSAICLLLLACIAGSTAWPAFREARAVLMVVLFSFAAATLAATMLKELVGRERPAIELGGLLHSVNVHGSPSFPSGHAAKVVALALPFVLLVPANLSAIHVVKIVMLLDAILVCYSRIVLGAHYLSDVLAGAAVAFACLPVAIWAANRVFTRGKVTPEKLDTVVKRQMFVLLALAVGLPFL